MRTFPFSSFGAGYPNLHTKVCDFRRALIFRLFGPGAIFHPQMLPHCFTRSENIAAINQKIQMS
jgi:hypothetical protein